MVNLGARLIHVVVSHSDGSYCDERSDEAKESESCREGASTYPHLIPSGAQNGHNLENKSRGGKEHAKMITPFEELNRG